MAKVPLPDRGQPLDVTYMYQLANAINDVADTVSTATGKYATIDTRQVGKQTFKIPDIRVFAGYVDVTTAQQVTATQVIDATPQDFGISFKYPPIVTASIVNNNTNKIDITSNKNSIGFFTYTGCTVCDFLLYSEYNFSPV